jgi:hypothetical protein
MTHQKRLLNHEQLMQAVDELNERATQILADITANPGTDGMMEATLVRFNGLALGNVLAKQYDLIQKGA